MKVKKLFKMIPTSVDNYYVYRREGGTIEPKRYLYLNKDELLADYGDHKLDKTNALLIDSNHVNCLNGHHKNVINFHIWLREE